VSLPQLRRRPPWGGKDCYHCCCCYRRKSETRRRPEEAPPPSRPRPPPLPLLHQLLLLPLLLLLLHLPPTQSGANSICISRTPTTSCNGDIYDYSVSAIVPSSDPSSSVVVVDLDHDGIGEVVQAGPYGSSRIETWKRLTNASLVQLDYLTGTFASFSPQLTNGVYGGGIGKQ